MRLTICADCIADMSPRPLTHSVACGKVGGSHTAEFSMEQLDKLLTKTVRTKTGCLEWRGRVNAQGYGMVIYNDREWRVHRLMWTITNGPVPQGLYVLHKCDNRICCEPDHLFIGTQRDNIADMIAKGRGRWRRNLAKMTDDELFNLLEGKHTCQR